MWAVAAAAPGGRQGAAREGRRRAPPLGGVEPDDGRAASRIAPLQQGHPARRRYGADVRGTLRRSRVGEAARGSRSERERRRCVGRQRHRDGGARRVRRDCRVPARAGRRPERRRRRVHGAPRRRSCDGTLGMVTALLAHGADPNAPGRGLDADTAFVEGLQLRARAGRRHALLAGGPLQRTRRHAAAPRVRGGRAGSCTTASTTRRSRSSRVRMSPTR